MEYYTAWLKIFWRHVTTPRDNLWKLGMTPTSLEYHMRIRLEVKILDNPKNKVFSLFSLIPGSKAFNLLFQENRESPKREDTLID